MASVTRKTGASGARSPYWQAKFKGHDGRTVWLSTKLSNEKKALAIAERWEEASRLTRDAELTQPRAALVIDQISKLTGNPETLKATENLLAELLEQSSGENLQGRNLSQYCVDWLASRSVLTAPASHAKYAAVINRFLESLPEQRRTASVGSITPSEVERYLNTCARDGLTATTVNIHLTVLRTLFNSARRQGIALTNPASGVESRASDSEERIPFTDAQIKALLEVASPEWRGMILLGVHAGLRISDASGLTWANIDLSARTLCYQPRKTSRRKKPRERAVTVWLHDDLIAYLESLPAGDVPDAPLFPSLPALPTSGARGLSKLFLRLMAQASVHSPTGIEKSGRGRRFSSLSFHSLRHTFVSRLANLEVSNDLRKELVGHASDDIHDRYTHLAIDLQRVAINRLPSVL